MRLARLLISLRKKFRPEVSGPKRKRVPENVLIRPLEELRADEEIPAAFQYVGAVLLCGDASGRRKARALFVLKESRDLAPRDPEAPVHIFILHQIAGKAPAVIASCFPVFTNYSVQFSSV